MAFTFKLYADAGLTVVAPNPFVFTFPEDDVPGNWQKQQLWLGSTETDRKVRDATAPGVTNIILTLTDNDPGAGTPTVSDAELSLDDVAYVTPSLDFGVTELLSGVGNAVTFWLRAQIFAGATPATYTAAVSFATAELEEIDV